MVKASLRGAHVAHLHVEADVGLEIQRLQELILIALVSSGQPFSCFRQSMLKVRGHLVLLFFHFWLVIISRPMFLREGFKRVIGFCRFIKSLCSILHNITKG